MRKGDKLINTQTGEYGEVIREAHHINIKTGQHVQEYLVETENGVYVHGEGFLKRFWKVITK